MKKILALSLNDFRNIMRDRTLNFLFLAIPVINLLLATYLLPWLAANFEEVVPYTSIMLLFLVIQSANIYGFITGFILLEEKDEAVLPVLKVMPLAAHSFIAYRMIFPFLFAFSFVLATIKVPGIVEISWGAAILLALILASFAPMIVLILSSYARNKVEGLALYKGLNLVIQLPIAAFFIDSNWRFALSLLPPFWSYQSFVQTAESAQLSWNWFLPALAFNLLMLGFFLWQFRKRVF